jgi:hypothetical protein
MAIEPRSRISAEFGNRRGTAPILGTMATDVGERCDRRRFLHLASRRDSSAGADDAWSATRHRRHREVTCRRARIHGAEARGQGGPVSECCAQPLRS